MNIHPLEAAIAKKHKLSYTMKNGDILASISIDKGTALFVRPIISKLVSHENALKLCEELNTNHTRLHTWKLPQSDDLQNIIKNADKGDLKKLFQQIKHTHSHLEHKELWSANGPNSKYSDIVDLETGEEHLTKKANKAIALPVREVTLTELALEK